ncbi:MAG: ABC transporter permease, partial [Verrucomicrobiae bacterium]|nr:ABC transporter permease [Verrucomicrobiae bacterium]
FNLYAMGFALIAFFINLLIMGWAMGMLTTGLILRWGQAAEALAWGIPFLVQPIAAVFYPVNVLPAWVQPIAWVVPATHVFEGMRAVLQHREFDQAHFIWAIGLNVIYLLGGAWFFRWMYASARARGLLAKLATQ